MNWELELQRCLDKRWLVRMPEARHLAARELNVARDDLAEAEGGYKRKSYKWSTIQSYYAMFHAARSLLYSRGYREKSHYCLSVAMRHLFVAPGILDVTLIDDLDDARILREDADYRAKFSQASADYSVKAARCLIARIGELLAGWDSEPGGQE
jgi:uncharacterized protein (UPF0332 family)